MAVLLFSLRSHCLTVFDVSGMSYGFLSPMQRSFSYVHGVDFTVILVLFTSTLSKYVIANHSPHLLPQTLHVRHAFYDQPILHPHSRQTGSKTSQGRDLYRRKKREELRGELSALNHISFTASSCPHDKQPVILWLMDCIETACDFQFSIRRNLAAYTSSGDSIRAFCQ